MCVCVNDEKSWNIKLKDTKNIYFLIRKVFKHQTKWNKKSIFNLFLSMFLSISQKKKFVLIYDVTLENISILFARIQHLIESYTFPHEIFAFIVQMI